MSFKTVGWIIILLVIAGGAWYLWGMNQPAMEDAMQETGAGDDMHMQAEQSPQQNTGISANSTSDADLDADLNAIDSQMSAASDSSASANSFNDTPVQQTE